MSVRATARRLRIDLAYDGTDFHGWQVQPGARTVQGVLGAALERIQGQGGVTVRGAGRTDAGAHARGQVTDVEVRTRLTDGELACSLRGILPRDLRPLRVCTVRPEFHSQHDAVSKTYRYLLERSTPGDPFLARYALHHPHPMDREALDRVLQGLPGRRDWSSFAGSACYVEDRVREVMEASYEEPAPGVGVFTFTADGFLNHMVRNLVGTLLDVARGRLEPDRIGEILAREDRRLAGPCAPARGLVLDRVTYAEEPEEVPGTFSGVPFFGFGRKA